MNRKDHVKMHSYPGMVAVVGVFHEGKVNFMAAGWHARILIYVPTHVRRSYRKRKAYI
ncbi:hypothetical protein SAMN05421677_12238 [Halobacillus aidingensis]|uniref:Uncharacterized protein n=1 Tax=Halobacillus aidingensis TaxID=240303 RepID=A0A1H0TR92_HALAD|nr:hypothetical protein SAMN05421677_12238 [Halobacillus aidingensis]